MATDLAKRTTDPVELGQTLAQSGYFKDARSAAQAAVKVMAGQELGLGPIASMTGVHIIEGKPSVGANLLAALVKRHPDYRYRVLEHTDKVCSIEFSERTDDGWETCGPPSTFTIDDAAAAKLSGRANWRTYPRNMLFARALSNGVRWYAPDVAGGAPVYTYEELGGDVDGVTGELVDVADAEVLAIPEHAEGPAAEQADEANRKLLGQLVKGVAGTALKEAKAKALFDSARTLDEKRALTTRLEGMVADLERTAEG